jgi:hypothetical protein
MAGSRLVFDLSSERGYSDDAYYTAVSPALYQGRAQALDAAIVQSNSGAAVTNDPGGGHSGRWAGSHGNSMVVSGGGDGTVLARAPHTGEHIVVADLAGVKVRPTPTSHLTPHTSRIRRLPLSLVCSACVNSACVVCVSCACAWLLCAINVHSPFATRGRKRVRGPRTVAWRTRTRSSRRGYGTGCSCSATACRSTEDYLQRGPQLQGLSFAVDHQRTSGLPSHLHSPWTRCDETTTSVCTDHAPRVWCTKSCPSRNKLLMATSRRWRLPRSAGRSA